MSTTDEVNSEYVSGLPAHSHHNRPGEIGYEEGFGTTGVIPSGPAEPDNLNEPMNFGRGQGYTVVDEYQTDRIVAPVSVVPHHEVIVERVEVPVPVDVPAPVIHKQHHHVSLKGSDGPTHNSLGVERDFSGSAIPNTNLRSADVRAQGSDALNAIPDDGGRVPRDEHGVQGWGSSEETARRVEGLEKREGVDELEKSTAPAGHGEGTSKPGLMGKVKHALHLDKKKETTSQ
ncbi:hypothetical protein SAICODRAFT_22273 [Saitoella complicata NRRL Y-17804]|nr:uncharacterized protein SAICODRAFT_22273 [Saitoella complicata NRRL Y-17804]ODQ49717.1 hypothetical protein SAICODRAFT_22273 [Saitoella complicata NRRL Y-17804]